jgi:hypothetical protein
MNDMTDDLQSWFGNPGEPVAEVDPDDLKLLWQKTRGLQISFSPRALADRGLNATPAVWYRSSMILILRRAAQEKLSPWIKDEQVSDAVFRTMATIPMTWIGRAGREGLPFDVEDFFRGLTKAGLQNG